MVTKRVAVYPGAKIKWSGPFDLSLLYQRFREWFIFMGYGDPATKELKYEEKIKPAGKTVNFKWKCVRAEEAGYFELVIEMEFGVTRLNEIQVERDGQSIKIDSGDIEIVFDAYVLRDPKNKWSSKFGQDIYDKYLSNYRFEELKAELYEDMANLMDEIKAFLTLYRFK